MEAQVPESSQELPSAVPSETPNESPPDRAGEASLRWRIPVGADPQRLRIALVQLLLSTIVCTIILLVAVPRETLLWAIGGMAPIVLLAAYWKWRNYRRALIGPDNVWLDATGLHWLDLQGHAHELPRADAAGFRIAIEPDTLHHVYALTLLLQSQFESQPFELLAPATPDAVRAFLARHWQIGEVQAVVSHDGKLPYDRAIDLYSECHSENYHWHFDGNRAAIEEFCDLLAQIPSRFPLPPLGAKPRGSVVLARRGHPSYVRLEHAPRRRIDLDLISGPADFLTQLAEDIRQQIPPTGADAKFDVLVVGREKWTLHLHTRE